jgi:hypothetical protein
MVAPAPSGNEMSIWGEELNGVLYEGVEII